MIESIPHSNKNIESQECDCTNPVCTHNTADEKRADMLLEYTEPLSTEPLLMPLREDKRGPVIRGVCRLDSEQAKSYLVTPTEAAKRIREDSVRGFYIYAGKESHNTEDLLFTDEDEPEQWPELTDSLQVISGSGTGCHRTWIRTNWPRKSEGQPKNSSAKDDLSGAGCIRTYNVGVVVSGSIHHRTEGVYHTVDTHPPVSLSPQDVPIELLPKSYSAGTSESSSTNESTTTSTTETDKSPSSTTSTSGGHTYSGLSEPDDDAVQAVQKSIRGFRINSESSQKAIEYFENLREGKNLREHGFIPRDPENKKGCRHEANLSLASKLYGMLLMDGETDKDRNEHLIHQYLSYVAQQYEWTDMGQRRKLLLSDEYIADTVTTAIESFNHEEFTRWMRKSEEYNFTGEYSSIMENRVIMATEILAKENESYPTRKDVVNSCYDTDDSRTKRTYGECLRRIAGKKLKKAHLGGNQYQYYPLGMPDPENAESVKPIMGW